MISSQKVVDREFGNLSKINDNYPKYVISMDEFPINTTHKGINHISLPVFLSKTRF